VSPLKQVCQQLTKACTDILSKPHRDILGAAELEKLEVGLGSLRAAQIASVTKSLNEDWRIDRSWSDLPNVVTKMSRVRKVKTLIVGMNKNEAGIITDPCKCAIPGGHSDGKILVLEAPEFKDLKKQLNRDPHNPYDLIFVPYSYYKDVSKLASDLSPRTTVIIYTRDTEHAKLFRYQGLPAVSAEECDKRTILNQLVYGLIGPSLELEAQVALFQRAAHQRPKS
jgi:hypothetical protein